MSVSCEFFVFLSCFVHWGWENKATWPFTGNYLEISVTKVKGKSIPRKRPWRPIGL
jgi:hypothetical protein